MDRNKIIKKLKDIKDPRERDKIIWALAGMQKEVMSEKPSAVQPTKVAQGPLGTNPGISAKTSRFPGRYPKAGQLCISRNFYFFRSCKSRAGSNAVSVDRTD